MGIQFFKKLIDHYCKDAVRMYPLSTLKDKKICVDLLGLGYTMWSIAHKEIVNDTNLVINDPDPDRIFAHFLSLIRTFLDRLFVNNITPIFVIDGEKSDEKKKFTGEKRTKNKQDRQDRLEKIKEKIKKIGNLLEITSEMLKELKQAHLNNSRFQYENIAKFKQFITDLGLPLLYSQGMTGEADKLCAFLCKNGYVQGVFSGDRDLLVFGSPYIITKNVGYLYNSFTQKNEYHIEVILLENILKGTGLTYKQFVDVCILAGCDYNNKLPGQSIVTICELIKKYGEIENLPSNYNVKNINYVVSRKYFCCPEKYEELCSNPDYKLEIDYTKLNKDLEQKLKELKMEDWINKLKIYHEIFKKTKIIPIKTEKGIMRLKIRIKNENITSSEEWVKKRTQNLTINEESFKPFIKNREK